MPNLVLPTTTMPGQKPQECGGRLINCFVESLGKTGPSEAKYPRCPGMASFSDISQANFRGGIQVAGLAYTVWSSGKVVQVDQDGNATVLSGTIPGTGPVSLAANNAATPDLVCVAPGDGAFVISTTTASAYPDADVGSPNSVCFLKGYFVFSYGDGSMQASDLNSTNIDTLNSATAESKSDTLYRVIADGEVLVALGSSSIEYWQINGEATGFPFSPVATHKPARGVVGTSAVGGQDEGFGYGVFFVGDDLTVRQNNGFSSVKISSPDLDRLIAAVEDKSEIQVSAYVTQGHAFAVVQCNDWTWEYDVGLSSWHERKSYNLERWKGVLPFKAFDKWLCGNTQTSGLFEIDHEVHTEDSEPLIWEIETAPQGGFPNGVRVNRLDLFFTGGVGAASGEDPIETNPSVSIYITRDLGLSWSNPWVREIGAQGKSPNVRVNNMGLCKGKGVRFKIRGSDPVHMALMGGAFQGTALNN